MVSIHNVVQRLFLLLAAIVWAGVVEAVCPVCLVAAGAGVGLSQYLEIDDLITGLWLGAMLYAMLRISVGVANRYLKWWPAVINWLLFAILYYMGTLLALQSYNLLGHELNLIWGVDRLIWGTALGTVLSIIGDVSYQVIKKRHGGHAWFRFQKVVMALVPLLIASWVFWYWGL